MQEIQRVLRELSERAAERAPATLADLDTLGHLDLAFARAALADEMEATEPAVGDEGILRLPALRHPVIPPGGVGCNDLALGEGSSVLVLSGSTVEHEVDRFPYRPTRIVESIADVVPLVAALS